MLLASLALLDKDHFLHDRVHVVVKTASSQSVGHLCGVSSRYSRPDWVSDWLTDRQPNDDLSKFSFPEFSPLRSVASWFFLCLLINIKICHVRLAILKSKLAVTGRTYWKTPHVFRNFSIWYPADRSHRCSTMFSPINFCGAINLNINKFKCLKRRVGQLITQRKQQKINKRLQCQIIVFKSPNTERIINDHPIALNG